ncbi:MAG: MFS transporter [Rikenellaceae bacterium]|nr:MFS transporter [Rikenellaceae bacterium]
MMQIQTGKGTLSLLVLLAIWSVSAVSSLPGLAVSPILSDLSRVFPKATELEIQLLTSLPSLLIIPFVLLAGKLSEGRDHRPLLLWGLGIFFVCGALCLVVRSIGALILVSSLLGIGAGMVIPLSTGLVVAYFTGDYRVRQLGYASAVNNLSLVLATALTGYLAAVNWHLPFLVYLLSGLSFLLCLSLRDTPVVPEPKESLQMRQREIDRNKLVGMMWLYFVITYAVLVVTYDVSFLVERYHLHETFSGWLISLFFLAIMLPGLFLGRIIRALKSDTNLVALMLIFAGLLLFGFVRTKELLLVAALLTGFGYGVMQPIIYDKTATIAPPRSATLALSFVMAMNYLAVMICPFILSGLHTLFHDASELLGFRVNTFVVGVLLLVALFDRKGFVLGLDEAYFVK